MMKRILGGLLLLFVFLNASASKIVTDSVKSQVLNTYVKYNVYLPDGYENSTAHYPIVYLLHGLYGHYDIWRVQGRMQDVADRVIHSGECRPCIIIMPNAGGTDVVHVQNGYFNEKDWNYEDFFFTEFLPTVEAKYRAGGTCEERAIMGFSMGGGGSIAYCQRHPGIFSSCFGMSPWLDNQKNEVGPGKEPDCLWRTCESVKKNSDIAFVQKADEPTVAALKKTHWYVDCGDDDFLLHQTFEFYTAMKAKGIPCQLTVRDGIHDWEYWHAALPVALSYASRCFYGGY